MAGKVALITGGARGQGAAEGRLFAAAGATVVLADVLDEDGAARGRRDRRAQYVHLDVTSEEEWQTVVDDIVARHGRLDVLVNNAGILRAATLVKETDRAVGPGPRRQPDRHVPRDARGGAGR